MILGLHGKMGSGKNEAARRLAVLSDLPVVEVSYAAKLKQSVAALLGITLADIERWKNERVHLTLVRGAAEPLVFLTFREVLQRYGTESHRNVFGEDFWLDAALPEPRHAGEMWMYKRKLHVVTDVRFPNEKDRIEQLGGEVVRIVGPNEDTGSHASEQVLECARVIDNTVRDDGFAALDAQLRDLIAAPIAA